MKAKIIIGCFLCLFTIACTKVPDHYVRISNQATRTIDVVLDDTLSYSIPVNDKTKYVSLEEGIHTISGDYSLDFTIEGEGTFHWTLELYDDAEPVLTYLEE